MPLPPGTLIGKYRVQRQLAQGGMAEVYLATAQGAEGFEKPVVIKRIRSELAHDTSFVEMFIAEAHLASRLSHPNLVHIFDFDRHLDSYYLAMEYIHGRSLVEARKRAAELHRSVPPLLVAQIGLEVARGLGYAHKLADQGKPLNLVHRDVTPHNVLLSYDGAVKLTDFGIAKAAGRATTVGALKGKFAYMAPEQARGQPVDARTDLFALGITLWELLTGGRLFQGETDWAVLHAVQERPVVPPAQLNPEVDEELSRVVMKALERVPQSRYQSAAELERALLQVVLHKSRAPEDTDVGAFVRELFPLQADSPEGTRRVKSAPTEWSIKDESAATVVPAAAASRNSTERGALPPDLLAAEPSQGARTQLLDVSEPSQAQTQGGGSPPGHADEGPTLRASAPVAEAAKARLQALSSSLAKAFGKLTAAVPSRGLWGAAAGLVLAALVAAVVLAGRRPAAPPPPPPPVVAPSPPAAAAAEPPVVPLPEPAVPAADEGFLELTLLPGGTVSVDGKEVAKVEGTERFILKAGRHEVMATDGKVITAWSVSVRPGGTVKKQFTFPKHK